MVPRCSWDRDEGKDVAHGKVDEWAGENVAVEPVEDAAVARKKIPEILQKETKTTKRRASMRKKWQENKRTPHRWKGNGLLMGA